MTNFGEIPFSEEAKTLILKSVENYGRHGIQIKFFADFDDDKERRVLRVNIAQVKKINDKILTGEELQNRVIDVFKDVLPTEYPIIISTNVYQP